MERMKVEKNKKTKKENQLKWRNEWKSWSIWRERKNSYKAH